MFKLKFFILFALAVICFGSEDNEGEAEGGSSTAKKENRTLGSDLPGYIGTSEDRKEYMMKLFKACGGQKQEYSVNEKDIFFHNCTYICKKRSTPLTPVVRRIPKGMICNRDEGVLGTVKVKLNHLEQKNQNRTLGQDLPWYIGNSEQKKQYMMKLLSACGGQSQEYKLNEKQIWFHNCTYICVRRNTALTSEVRQIPEGMICNRDKGTCPKEGNCPLPMC
ncbi:uncharacterized protein LOC115308730 [Ixodes scapularis]|uniref:uncharacterized protein LOC115308730 n=1 Tax=Ixodes scapularis TaxID=6945 RepID=UPI001A9E61C0|nr:uncharacterized protein LOC115308730 [Ixodes scapularis]